MKSVFISISFIWVCLLLAVRTRQQLQNKCWNCVFLWKWQYVKNVIWNVAYKSGWKQCIYMNCIAYILTKILAYKRHWISQRVRRPEVESTFLGTFFCSGLDIFQDRGWNFSASVWISSREGWGPKSKHVEKLFSVLVWTFSKENGGGWQKSNNFEVLKSV